MSFPGQKRHVVVIGGGISGLATARRIADIRPDFQVTVLEAGKRPGGTISTQCSDGFVFEAGPSGFLNRDPSTLRLADRLGLSDQVITGDETKRCRYIVVNGKLEKFPDSPFAFATSPLLRKRARARVALEPAFPKRPQPDESVASFCRRRLGKDAADLMVDPLIAGIYAGDPEKLSVRATLPQIAGIEDRGMSLIGTFLKGRKTVKTPSERLGTKAYVSFRVGIGQLIAALVHSLGGALRVKSPVLAVNPTEHGWAVSVGGPNPTTIHADAVVSAAPAPAAQNYLGHLDPALDTVCAGVRYAPVVMLALGYDEKDVSHPLDGFGYLVPSREGGSVLGALWTSTIYPGLRCDADQRLIQVILGGTRDPEAHLADEDELRRRARDQLRTLLGIEAKPTFSRLLRHRPGIPQYHVGHLDRLAAAESALEDLGGLFLTGNAFYGIGLNTCTKVAETLAERVAKYVDQRPAPDFAQPVLVRRHAN